MVLFDWEANGEADHIATVASYDPTTSALITIGGNDSGYVLDTTGKYDASHDAGAQTGGAAMGQGLRPGTQLPGQAGGHVGVGVRVIGAQLYGIGRPSLVDFEDHVYDHHAENQNKAPAKPSP